MLTGGHGEYWLATTTKRGEPSDREYKPLQRGSTTLIAGPLGAGKTSLCMQFLLQDAVEKYFPKQNASPISTPGGKANTNLYFCLGSDAHETVRAAWKTPDRRSPAALARDRAPGSYEDHISVLDFFQSQFDFNHLMAHLYWAIKEFRPNRIVFDGLSEWLTLYSRAEAAKMLEAVGALISHHPNYQEDSRSEKVPRPAVFMTYDLPMTGDPLAPQNLGMVASNIIAVKQISIKDEIRRVIYILKSETTQHDQNVRELRADKEGVLKVHTGLDTFNGLLVGPIESAEVLLQLFRENYPQRCFNQWLVHRLASEQPAFQDLDFSRSEIGRTLEYTDSSTRFPPADLKILSVDEWCLSTESAPTDRDGKGGESSTLAASSSLLDLRLMWSSETNPQRLAASWQDFWVFDLEKAGPENASKSIYAVPGYMDFGMFCVNAELLLHSAVLRRAVLGEVELDQDEVRKQELTACYPQNPVLPEDRQGTGHETPMRVFDDRHKATIEKIWQQALTNLPRYLVEMEGDGPDAWFNPVASEGRPKTIVDLMLQRREEDQRFREAKGSNPRDISDGQWGFAFDMATRETCVCVFFELAWGFGASEDLFKSERWQANEQASVNAIKFLQFLVLEKLMPACPTVDTTRRSLFSHHFYSTLRSVADLDRWDVKGHKDEESEYQRHDRRRVDEHPPSPPKPTPYAPPRLVALPIFPSGSRQVGLGPLVRDIQRRLEFIARRFKLCAGSGCRDLGAKLLVAAQSTTAADAIPEMEVASLPADIEKLVRGTNELIATVKSPGFGKPEDTPPVPPPRTGPTPELADLLELVHWHVLRMNLLLAGDDGGGTLKAILTANTNGLTPLPAASPDDGKRFVPTGFGCSGSWMYGVHNVTRSASLASDLLQEITSLDAAEERARRGAGLPARRQFFDLHGHEQVPGMEYFNWRELLRFCGCRSRRRERALPDAGAPAAEIFQQIHRELQACLEYAKLRREDYWRDSSREAVIVDSCRMAKAAFRRIVATALRSTSKPAPGQ